MTRARAAASAEEARGHPQVSAELYTRASFDEGVQSMLWQIMFEKGLAAGRALVSLPLINKDTTYAQRKFVSAKPGTAHVPQKTALWL